MTFEGYPAPPDVNFVATVSEMSSLGLYDVADMTTYMRQQSAQPQENRLITTSRATLHAWAKRTIRYFKQDNSRPGYDSTERKLEWVRSVRWNTINHLKAGWRGTTPLLRRKIRPVLRWQFAFFAWLEYQLMLQEVGELL